MDFPMYKLNRNLYESSKLLAGSDDYEAIYEAQCILEDVQAPASTSFTNALLQQVVDKGHIDFDDIPKSKGNIKNYSQQN